MKSDILYASLAENSAGYVIDYVFSLKKSNPEFIRRVVTKKTKDRYSSQPEDNVEHLVKGWKWISFIDTGLQDGPNQENGVFDSLVEIIP